MMHRPNVTVLAVRSMSGMGVFGLEEWRRVLHWDRLGIDRGNYTPSSHDTPWPSSAGVGIAVNITPPGSAEVSQPWVGHNLLLILIVLI